jgi:hypothetical protein
MAQSSALRREETIPAPTPITINAQNIPNPKNASIADDGSVTFNAAQACWLYFLPTGVFGDSSGLLKLATGNNGPFYPAQPNMTVAYSVTDPNTTCTPGRLGNGGNSIKVG